MDISAEKIIEKYAQELARVQNQLFVTQAALDAYQEQEAKQAEPVDADN